MADDWRTTPICSRHASPAHAGSMPSTVTEPRVALAVALEDLDRRRLAGAVGAEEAEDLARGDLEADPANGLDLAVGLAEIGNGDRR